MRQLSLAYVATFVLCPRYASGTGEHGNFAMSKACIVGALDGCSSTSSHCTKYEVVKRNE